MSKADEEREITNDPAIDPLDAFMASIDSEIMQQVAAARVSPPSSTGTVAPAPSTPPLSNGKLSSPAQVEVANKVATSPFYDMLQRRRSESIVQNGEWNSHFGGVGITDASEACLRLLQSHPSEFLRRYGHILSPIDLEALVPSLDPEVALHAKRLQILMSKQRQESPASEQATATAAHPENRGIGRGYRNDREGKRSCPADGARVRNRRYRRLQQLDERGVWFSDEAMKERDPWLWHECVGRWAGEEEPAPRDATEQVPGSTSVGTYLQESLGFLSQAQVGNWPTETSLGATSRGRGPCFGMAFLHGCATGARGREHCERIAGEGATAVGSNTGVSGLLEADDGTMEEEPEQKLGSDDAPDSSQSQTTPSPGVRRLPDDSSSGGNTAEVAAAVAAIRIRDGSEGDAGGAGREDRPDGVQRDRRFTFAEGTADGEGDAGGAGREDRPDGVQRDRRVTFAEGTADGGQDQNAPDAGDVQVEEEEIQEEEGDREGGREEIARILWERFLDGEEEGVNYTDVDGDERLDDLDQIDRDEEDRWFGGQEDDTVG